MKYVFIITLFALVAFFVYWRLRPYLKVARNVLGVLRDARSMSAGGVQSSIRQQQREEKAVESLVRCSACETWLPASRAIALRGSNEAYCSQACVERPLSRETNEKSARRS